MGQQHIRIMQQFKAPVDNVFDAFASSVFRNVKSQRRTLLIEKLVVVVKHEQNVVRPYGGAFGATRGLHDAFGPERVIDMPVSEAGYVGAAVGAAATGIRPVVELQFSDWITIASDQLINQAANMRYMFGGVISVPLVLRAPVGGYLSAAAQHSHMFESMFAFVPGLKVVLPGTPHDARWWGRGARARRAGRLELLLQDRSGGQPDDEHHRLRQGGRAPGHGRGQGF